MTIFCISIINQFTYMLLVVKFLEETCSCMSITIYICITFSTKSSGFKISYFSFLQIKWPYENCF